MSWFTGFKCLMPEPKKWPFAAVEWWLPHLLTCSFSFSFYFTPKEKNEKKGETKRLRDWQCSHLPTMTSSTITFTCLRHVFWDKTIENTIFRPQKSSNHTDKPHGFCCQTKTYTPPAQRPQPAWTSTKISRSSKPCFNKTSLYWERPEGQGRIPFKPRKWIKNQKDSPKLRVLKAHTHTMDSVTWMICMCQAAPSWTHIRNRQTIQKFGSAAPISRINITTCSPKWYKVTLSLLGCFNPEWFLKQTKIQRQTWNFHNFSRFFKLKGCKKEMVSTFP